MTGFWAWVGRHALALSLGSGLIAVLLLAGGIALGLRQAPAPATAELGPQGQGTVPVAAQVPASGHALTGVVWLIGHGRALVRGGDGAFYVVTSGADTRYRKSGHTIPGSQLRVGDRVLVLGSPTPSGAMHALLVTVTGHVTIPPQLRRRLPASPGTSPRRTPTVTPE